MFIALHNTFSSKQIEEFVITSYSIHYTKLYEFKISIASDKSSKNKIFLFNLIAIFCAAGIPFCAAEPVAFVNITEFTFIPNARITSYNVCYTKLLRG